MDKEYLQNIAGSPHVDEGLGDRILARGTSGLQRLSAMSGGDIDDLNYRKVNTLLITFIKRLTSILKDFAEGNHSVANRLEQMRPRISPTQRFTIEQMRDLYDLITPTTMQQHQLGHSVLNPQNKNRTSITEMLQEGIFSRELSLNKALQTNNPDKILAAYLSEIQKAYSGFLRDAQKVTGTPVDYIKRIVGNLDKKWEPLLAKVESVLDSPSNLSPLSAPSTPTAGAAAPSTATDVPPASPQTTNAGTPPDEGVPEPKSVEEDFISITTNVIDIIIKAVRGDVERSNPYFKPKADGGEGYEELPTDWDSPSVTKEAAEPKDAEVPMADAPAGEKNEFLYNFHSMYRKQRHFAIELPSSTNATYTNRKTKQLNKLEVIWSNDSHENSIYIKHTPVKVDSEYEQDNMSPPKLTPLGKSGDVLIFKFYDDQVNPRDSQGKNFSIELLLEQANKTTNAILKKVNRSNPKLLAELNKRAGSLQRALYATVSRKRMEFKPKKSVSLQMKDGKIFLKGNPVSPAEIKQKLFSSSIVEAKNWLEALDDIDYFTEHPEMVATRNKADAILQLIGQDVLHSDAIEAVMKSSEKIGNLETVPVATLVTLAKQHYLQKVKQAELSGETPSTTATVSSTQPPVVPVPKPTAPPVVKPPVVPAAPSAPVVKPTATPVVKPPVVPPAAPVPPVTKPVTPPPAPKPKIDIADNGAITGLDPTTGASKTWKPGQALPDSIRTQIKADPSLMKKLEDIIAKRKAAKAKPVAKPTTESFINPFTVSNFL